MNATRKTFRILKSFALGTVIFCSVAALAQQHRTTISFADIGNVRSWQADGNEAVFIESSHNQWYRASFWSPCVDLPFVETIAFVTEPNGDLGRYSSILVDGDRCWFKEFEQASAPDSSDGRQRVR